MIELFAILIIATFISVVSFVLYGISCFVLTMIKAYKKRKGDE